ncbi:hypothetical protein [Halomicrococcus sp. NG-SE-24]|uniref:hypothetical protein n=1 Tax=Halomicrococcus sp. NG-SE-24 TaxID=3436928 RepID=UPI003D963B08
MTGQYLTIGLLALCCATFGVSLSMMGMLTVGLPFVLLYGGSGAYVLWKRDARSA